MGFKLLRFGNLDHSQAFQMEKMTPELGFIQPSLGS